MSRRMYNFLMWKAILDDYEDQSSEPEIQETILEGVFGGEVAVAQSGTFIVRGTNTRYCYLDRLGEGGDCITDLIEDVDSKEKYVKESMESYLAKDKISNYGNYINPNIARLIRHFTFGDSRVHMIFPYYEKGSLENKLAQQYTSLRFRTILDWFLDACRAVGYLHDKGKDTIDIRAANFYIDATNDLILLNIDRKWDTHRQRLYCAPEFIREYNRFSGRRCDIWSLGCLLFALIYLESPFHSIFERKGFVNASDMRSIDYPHYEFGLDIGTFMEDMLEYDFQKRPYIDEVIDRANSFYNGLTIYASTP